MLISEPRLVLSTNVLNLALSDLVGLGKINAGVNSFIHIKIEYRTIAFVVVVVRTRIRVTISQNI